MRFEAFSIDDVDCAVEHLSDIAFDAGIVEHRPHDIGVEIDQDIDVASWASFATSD